MIPAEVATVPQPGPHNGLQAKGTELWINGAYVTRVSKLIHGLQWYPDNEHVAYQAGNGLELYDIGTGITMDLATLPNTTPVVFGFQDGGRTLIYQNSGINYAAALYQQ